MSEKALLIILDGYGISESTESNAVKLAKSPRLDDIFNNYPHAELIASGSEVGLPAGQIGNSEVGHLNIGAGRIVYQDLSRITKAITDGDFFENEEFLRACAHANSNDSALHLMGLVSDGGVHSAQAHYFALIDLAKAQGVKKVYLHCYMDGRDTLPRSGEGFMQRLAAHIEKTGCGQIATVSGRYYAMDRDKRWERVKLAYDALVYGAGEHAETAQQAISDSYAADVTDEFILPTVIGDGSGRIAENDAIIFFNFRPDRARQLTAAFTQRDFDGFPVQRFNNLFYVCMTTYDASFENVHIAFSPHHIKNGLGEYLSSLGKTQLRIAETEKYAHVTYFFNGGVETPWAGEDRELIPSPKVASYDLQPEMSAYIVTEKLLEKLECGYDFIAVNFANPDMVGHTGVLEAAIKAIEAVDCCVGRVVDKARDLGYRIIVTADHGNAEKMSEAGEPFTAHTTNPVPVAVLADGVFGVKNARLCDIAPSLIDLMELSVPDEFEGTSFIVR